MEWHLYLVRCSDGALYTGIAKDVERRLAAHRESRGAKFLRGRGPLELVFRTPIGSRGDALRAELRVKALTREAKEALIAGTLGIDAIAADLAPDGETGPAPPPA